MSSAGFIAGARPALRRYLPSALAAAVALALPLYARPAAAHIELQLPMNRYSDIKSGDNKACPCGSGSSNRRCSVPSELSDPERSTDRISTFAPGDTITVRFDEYVGHSGRYRVAFDPDGADLDDFNETILLDEPDPEGKAGNVGSGSIWEFQVTLPNMTCDNCSLQLIQVMDGNTEDEVLNPVDRGSTYFQCADIRLVAGTPAGGIAPSNPSEHLGIRARNELAEAQAEAAAANEAMEAMEEAEMTVAEMAPSPMPVSSPSAPVASGGAPRSELTGPQASSGSGCSVVAGGLQQRQGAGAATLGALSALLLVVCLRGRHRSRQ